ncbi:hypothetical protein BGZ93_002201 [Podila epicladia]|nr:hypothetical protein BGZ92_006196 [Podila epicladia]KAG0100332.1 hypothetical protein BGZ93_002201 [Podila epicladia]
MASDAAEQLHSPQVPAVNPSKRRHSGQHAKAKVNWRKSERVLELISTCVQGAFRVSPWETLSEVENDYFIKKVLPIDSEWQQVQAQRQASHQDHKEPIYYGKRVHEAPVQKTVRESTSSNLAQESFSGANDAKSANYEEDMSGSCATISQLLDAAEDEVPDRNVETQDNTEEEHDLLTQAAPPQISLQQSPAPTPHLPSTSTLPTKSHVDSQQLTLTSPRETESRSTSESPMKSTGLIPAVSTPPLKRNRSLPLNLSTEERRSLQVGDQELSAIPQLPQPHHLYSQSITDTDSAGPSMADQKKGPASVDTKSADPSLSPSVTSPTKKRPYQKTSIWNISPADFGYTGNESEPDARSKKKGKGSSTIQSSRSGSGSTSSLASLAAAHSSKPKARSAPRRQVSFTSSASSSLLEGNMEDIEGYVGEDLDGFENRLSY